MVHMRSHFESFPFSFLPQSKSHSHMSLYLPHSHVSFLYLNLIISQKSFSLVFFSENAEKIVIFIKISQKFVRYSGDSANSK